MSDLVLPVSSRDHVRGKQSADVTVVEYADVECPYCRQLDPVLREALAQRPNVRLVYRHFPLVDVHPHAYSSALALEAAAGGRFWELHDLLLTQGRPLGRQAMAQYAEQLGLEPAALLRPQAEQFDAKVREDFDSGVASGVQGTPGLFIDALLLRRTPTLQRLLDAFDRSAAA